MNGLRLRSNPTASLAYRNLSKTQFSLNNTLQRLSSGLRINKAADDSAGSAISTRMNSQITGMKQANENAQQANNLIQTAENGLNDISGMLSRMRELAVQASTDTLNDTDRASINLEYQALKNEITRLANVTEYNEMDILNGTYYRNQVDTDSSTADDVSGSSIQALDDVIKGSYSLQDALATDSNGALIDAVVTAGNNNISWISADGDVATGDYRLSLKSDGYIKLEKTSDGGTTWALASSDTISADSVSQNSTFTFQTTNGKDVTVTFPDSDSDGILDFKDVYPDNADKVKDLPSAFSGLSGNLKLWLDSREWSAIETDGTNASNWIDFSGKANHIGQSTTSETLSEATMIVVTKAGVLTPTDSSAGGIQLSDSSAYDEVLVFDRVLTGTEKTSINTYLTNKWGLGSGSGSGSEIFSYTGSIETWTVPAPGTYTIEAFGAQGGMGNAGAGGKGAHMQGNFEITGGQILKILVGQQGQKQTTSGGHVGNSTGGGGGTFVAKEDNTPLIIAGGGGGGGAVNAGLDAISDQYGLQGLGSGGASGGSNGNGGAPDGGQNSGRSGAGFYGDGGIPPGDSAISSGGPSSFVNGGTGGLLGGHSGGGGFGGGGQGGNYGGGGGGGYSGGGGGSSNGYGGGGGGSYNSGTNQSNTAGVRSGNGLVEISYDATSPGTYSATVDPVPDQVLSNFTVSSNRTLSLTDADGNSQRKDYVSSNQETLGFSDFGIQVNLDSTYTSSSGLNGTDLEIAAGRDLQVGADNDINHQLQLGINSVTASGLRIDGSQVLDIKQARVAITSLDHATDTVNQERSYLGSMQNRLSFTMSNLTGQTQSIEAARSSIQDTDFAADAADLAKNQILAQSGTAMLAQASAISQNILSLIVA